MNVSALSVISAILLVLAIGSIVILFILKSRADLWEKYSMMANHKCHKCGKKTQKGVFCMYCGEALGKNELPLKIIAYSVAGVMFVGGAGAGTAALWKYADGAEISAVAVSSSVPSAPSMEASSAEPSSVEALSSSTPPIKARYEMKWIKEPQYDYNLAYTYGFPGRSAPESVVSETKYSKFHTAFFVEKNEKYGVIDMNGTIIHPVKDQEVCCEYCAEKGIAEGTTIESVGHDGFIALCYYPDAKKFTNGYDDIEIKIPALEYKRTVFIVWSSGDNTYTFGYLDRNGLVALQGVYKAIHDIGEDKLAVQLQNGKWAIFDADGRPLSGFIYDRVGTFSEGYSAVSIDGKFGYIDNKLNVVIPPTYEQLSEVVYGRCYVKQDGLLGVAELVDNQSDEPNRYEAVKWKIKYSDMIYDVLEKGIGGPLSGKLSEVSIGDIDNDGVSEIYCAYSDGNSKLIICKGDEVIECFTTTGPASGGTQIYYNPKTKQIAIRFYAQGGGAGSLGYTDIYDKKIFSCSYEFAEDYMEAGLIGDSIYDVSIDKKIYRNLTEKERDELMYQAAEEKVGEYRPLESGDFDHTIALESEWFIVYTDKEQIAELLDKIDS